MFYSTKWLLDNSNFEYTHIVKTGDFGLNSFYENKQPTYSYHENQNKLINLFLNSLDINFSEENILVVNFFMNSMIMSNQLIPIMRTRIKDIETTLILLFRFSDLFILFVFFWLSSWVAFYFLIFFEQLRIVNNFHSFILLYSLLLLILYLYLNYFYSVVVISIQLLFLNFYIF